MAVIDAYLPESRQSENLPGAEIQVMEWITTIVDRIKHVLRPKQQGPLPEIEPEDPAIEIKKSLAVIEAAEGEEALAGLVDTSWRF